PAARPPPGPPRAAARGRTGRHRVRCRLAGEGRRRSPHRPRRRARRPRRGPGGLLMTVFAAEALQTAGDTRLIIAAILGIAAVVVLITWLKVHPLLALILGPAVRGAVGGLAAADTVTSFQTGVGTTFGNVGLLIALGAMIGGMLAASGGADRVVAAFVDHVSARRLPWAMAGVAALIGIPLFFEVGGVLLVPVVLLVSVRRGVPVLAVGIPALAGLSVLHGLVPPHPGPLVAI